MPARRSSAPRFAARPAALAGVLLALTGFVLAMSTEGAAQSFGDGGGSFREATDPAAAQDAIQRIAGSGRFQMELPPPREPEPPRQRDPIQPFELSDTAQAVLIGVLAVIVLIIVAQVARRRIAPTETGAERPAARVASAQADEEPTAAELRDAEAAALAAAEAGRWDEAVHRLLLGAIGRLRERDARATGRSLTSREILARHFRSPDRAEARAALAALVGAVEISLFGGRPADRAGFERCLDAYRALRRALAARPTRRAAA